MTQNSSYKKKVREYAAKHGLSYTQALNEFREAEKLDKAKDDSSK